MINFKQYLEEDTGEDKEHGKVPHTLHGMPRYLWQFLAHLSSPMHPHPNAKLDEITLVDNRKPSFEGMPKTQEQVNAGNRELGGQNHHKRIQEGLSKANADIDHPGKLKEARKTLQSFAESRGYKKFPKLLTENGKTEKSGGIKVHTKALFLAPHATSGLHSHKGQHFDVCPNASSECRRSCLGTEAGGNKQYPDNSLASKVVKTHALVHHPEEFARVLHAETQNHVRTATRKGMKPGVRLNGTSDIAFEKHTPNLFHKNKGAEFYDYTKNSSRVLNSLKKGSDHPSNYHLALSHTGSGHDESNDAQASKVLQKGGIVATVYAKKKKEAEPTHIYDHATGSMHPIVNGDSDDHLPSRHAQAGLTHGKAGHGVGSGLKLKGTTAEKAGNFANKVTQVKGKNVIEINKPK